MWVQTQRKYVFKILYTEDSLKDTGKGYLYFQFNTSFLIPAATVAKRRPLFQLHLIWKFDEFDKDFY